MGERQGQSRRRPVHQAGAGAEDYDVNERRNLLRKGEQPDPNAMIKRVTESYRWLGRMTDLERKITRGAKRILENELASLEAEAARHVGLADTAAEAKAEGFSMR